MDVMAGGGNVRKSSVEIQEARGALRADAEPSDSEGEAKQATRMA